MQGYVEKIDIILLIAAALYNFLMCFEWSILDSNSQDETIPYNECELDFD
jgi:hypothetical protein